MKTKVVQTTTNPTIETDKENIHPNIMRQTNGIYPKVSSFCPDHIPISPNDWRTRILQPSDREKLLQRKLARMLNPESSPKKSDKLLTEIPSQPSHSRMNMGNTLWRYLYERSIHNMSFSQKPQTDLMDELVRVTQQICGPWNIELLNLNSEETLAVVVDALREYHENRKIDQQMG